MPGLSVLQIDAHADLREAYQGSRYSHASAMRRVLEVAPCTQVGIRSLSREEAEALPGLETRIFYDRDMRRDPDWIDRVVDGLGERVYLTIDCDGLDPAILPAVGTPEPGGLGWYETLTLLRTLFAKREVVGCDLVELCPQARAGGVELPLREAGLQDPCLQVRVRAIGAMDPRMRARVYAVRSVARRLRLGQADLTTRVGRVDRLRELVDDPLIGLQSVRPLAGGGVGLGQLHQHAVGRHRSILESTPSA